MMEIAGYDPAWPRLFREMAQRLRGAVRETALRIDHIGSTSVPGLAAKPIIDIQISVAHLEPVDAYAVPLHELGYLFRPTNPDLTKRFFHSPPDTPRCHIHVRRMGSWSEQFALLFRDYMRTHAEDARRYADLKQSLATPDRDVQEYTELKGPFIWEIMVKATDWSQVIGWEPGPRDA
jgi:GrpB-like predicted nucleotidyltransferase (UPF0157 family)